MEWTDIAVAIVAIYGAELSTYNLIIKLKERFNTIKVDINVGFLSGSTGVSDTNLIISANNHSSKRVTLQPPYIDLPDNKKMLLMNYQSNITFPYELKPRNNCKVWNNLKRTAQSLKEEGYEGTIKIKGVYKDAIGNKYKSKALKLNLEEWSKNERN